MDEFKIEDFTFKNKLVRDFAQAYVAAEDGMAHGEVKIVFHNILRKRE